MKKDDKHCAECGISNEPLNKVFSFDDEDGKTAWLCNGCYTKHDEIGDWVS